MSDMLYQKMILRKRFCKRIVLIIVTFSICFYATLLLFGDLKSPLIMHLTDLNRCPACYGISICPELYSNQIIMERASWSNLFNAKNIYYGYTKSNKRVVLKKLAHNWELKEFDAKLCKSWDKNNDCVPQDLLSVNNYEENILKLVHFNFSWPPIEPRKGLVVCPYASSIFELIRPASKYVTSNVKSDNINLWTTLSINPEPLILQVLQKSSGWPVPAYGGVCGRLEVVSYDGETLSSLSHITWSRKLLIAEKIINAAMDFTFKHTRFRFYLMDWSLDNIVVNDNNEVSFIDLEDIIVLDKYLTPNKDLPNWYQRYAKEPNVPGFTFSIENMCKHHLSDHNLWAACYILAGDESPFLYPLPHNIKTKRPYFQKLFNDCLNKDDRFQTITKLQQIISDILHDNTLTPR